MKTQDSRLKVIILCSFSVVLTSISYAELPLSVEDIISQQGQVRIQLSTSYLNKEKETGGLSVLNSDSIVTTATVRYGLSKKTEVYNRFSFFASEQRAQNLQTNNIKSKSQSHFSNSWFGLNHQFRKDLDDKPALLGFMELQLAEKSGKDSSTVYAKSFILGGTTYQTYDPVVLALTSSLQLNAKRKKNGSSYQPGHALLLSPSVGFAVNEKVTLTTGASWQIKQANEVDDKKISMTKTQMSLNFGVGYAMNRKSIININIAPIVSSSGGVQTSLSWSYAFDKKR